MQAVALVPDLVPIRLLLGMEVQVVLEAVL
jgi:hypothetical protein